MLDLDAQDTPGPQGHPPAGFGRGALASATATLTLASRADVGRLHASLVRPVPRPAAVLIAVPALHGAERLREELALNAAWRDCGCTTGSALLTAAVIAFLALLCFAPGAMPSGARAWLAGVVLGLGAGAVGKGVGLLLARARLTRRLRALERRLAA
jgi:hypothetical protein